MTSADIVLIGYYGRGNFGDDVLMVVSNALARQMLPGANVAVLGGTTSTYLERLLGSDIKNLPYGTCKKHRLIIHGGGGTFFDFTDHGVLSRICNSLLFAGGVSNFIRCEDMLRKLAGRPRLSARTRIGLGLGIGTFTLGSSRIREALPVLADFDALWLRDSDSIRNLAQLHVTPPVVSGSDLAFLWEHWCPPNLVLAPMKVRSFRPRVGVVLRDWPSGSGANFAKTLMPVLTHLSTIYELTLISLDPATDMGILTSLAHLPQLLWTPEKLSISEFAKSLAAQDVFLTSRAHGAICGACLGRASVILAIEPKLCAVNAMLPNASRLVSSPFDPSTVAASINEALTISSDFIANDVNHNRTISLQALADVLQRANL